MIRFVMIGIGVVLSSIAFSQPSNHARSGAAKLDLKGWKQIEQSGVFTFRYPSSFKRYRQSSKEPIFIDVFEDSNKPDSIHLSISEYNRKPGISLSEYAKEQAKGRCQTDGTEGSLTCRPDQTKLIPFSVGRIQGYKAFTTLIGEGDESYTSMMGKPGPLIFIFDIPSKNQKLIRSLLFVFSTAAVSFEREKEADEIMQTLKFNFSDL